MHPHAEVIEQFYRAFQQRDAEGMIACYHPNVTFADPVFRQLSSDQARAMWRMLTLRGKDLDVTWRDVAADGQTGSAHWTARYSFSQTGRTVENRVAARFQFRDGKIIDHQDTFDLWRWAGLALGLQGRLLGWTPFMRNTIHQRAMKGLAAFMRQQGQAGDEA
jgi:ketosteroid isomerase-like protein